MVFDGLPKTCPIASPPLGKVVAHRVFAFWVGNCQNLELAPFNTCCPTSRQSIGNWVAHAHRSPLRLCSTDQLRPKTYSNTLDASVQRWPVSKLVTSRISCNKRADSPTLESSVDEYVYGFIRNCSYFHECVCFFAYTRR